MTFQEYFQQVKARFLGADISAVSDPTRIQINLTGQAAGTFYVEIKGGNLAIEPYEYRDRDVEITISSENFQKLIDGKLDPVAAFTFGKLKAQGDLGKALELKKLSMACIHGIQARAWMRAISGETIITWKPSCGSIRIGIYIGKKQAYNKEDKNGST